MTAVFADTFYFLALLNRGDLSHQRAVASSQVPGLRLVTTDLVMLELADALCKVDHRQDAMAIWELLETDESIELVEVTRRVLHQGRELYATRADKDWPLTDCVSFVVMSSRGLSEALTADRHFEQAGFRALLA
ncbi:MAG: PIN domain-containing protein [Verrucomicrobia bacterium]|nr:PIN domain-containing protein [Verrucomicrobiota bacterium]